MLSSIAEDEDLMNLIYSAKNHLSLVGFLLFGAGLVGELGAGVLVGVGTGDAGTECLSGVFCLDGCAGVDRWCTSSGCA